MPAHNWKVYDSGSFVANDTVVMSTSAHGEVMAFYLDNTSATTDDTSTALSVTDDFGEINGAFLDSKSADTAVRVGDASGFANNVPIPIHGTLTLTVGAGLVGTWNLKILVRE